MPRGSRRVSSGPRYRKTADRRTGTHAGAAIFLWGEPSSACRWDLRRTCGGMRARRPTDGMTTCANPARAIGDTAPYKIFRRGRCPHRPVRRPCAAHRTPCFVSLRASAHTGVAIRIPLRCAASARRCRPRLPFFLRRKKGRKERRQNQGFAILPRLRCRLRRSSLPRESGFAKFVPCFRMVSAFPSATRSALVLVWRDGGKPLRLPCGGVRARRPTKDMKACANSVRAVDDAGPPAAHALFHAGQSPPSSEKRNAKPPLLEKATVLH